jgi:hypothetical protein
MTACTVINEENAGLQMMGTEGNLALTCYKNMKVKVRSSFRSMIKELERGALR